jgi:hypothetical protein
MYAKNGDKVGEISVCLDLHFKRHPQRTSFELNELLSQTDPTLQLYPSHEGSRLASDGGGISFVSCSENDASILHLSSETLRM